MVQLSEMAYGESNGHVMMTSRDPLRTGGVRAPDGVCDLSDCLSSLVCKLLLRFYFVPCGQRPPKLLKSGTVGARGEGGV